MGLNMGAGTLGMVWVSVVFGMPFILWLEWLGARAWQIGLMVTIQQLCVLFQLPSAVWCERMRRHKTLWAMLAVPHRLLWIVPGVLSLTLVPDRPELAVYLVMVTVAVSGALGAMPVPLWFCWMGRLIPPAISGRFWGTRQAVVLAGFICSMLLVGNYLDAAMARDAARGFAWVFIIAAVCGASEILIHLGVPEPDNTEIPARTLSMQERLRIIRRHPDFLRFVLGMGALMFSIGLIGSFIPVHLKRTFAFSFAHQAWLPVFNGVGMMVSGLVLGRLIDRVGSRSVLIGLIILGPCTTFAWFFLHQGYWMLHDWPIRQALVVAIVIHLTGGFFYGGMGVCQLQMLQRFVPAEQRLFGTAFFWVSLGLLAASAPLLAGAIVDYVDAHPPGIRLPGGQPLGFFHILVTLHILAMWLLALPLLRGLAVSPGERPLRQHILSIIPGNSFRAVANTGMGPISSPPKLDGES